MQGILFTASPAMRNMPKINNPLTKYIQILGHKFSYNNRYKREIGLYIKDSKVMFLIKFTNLWEICRLDVKEITEKKKFE